MIEFIRMGAKSLAAIQVESAKIVYRRLGNGRPLLVLNGFGATTSDWDPWFIHRLASHCEVILLDNRAIGDSGDDGEPFDIARLLVMPRT
jgi:pimeloyl-ACP methyl ester carboxylesterase